MLVVVSRMFVCEETGKVLAHCVMLPEDEQGSEIMKQVTVANQSSDDSETPEFSRTAGPWAPTGWHACLNLPLPALAPVAARAEGWVCPTCGQTFTTGGVGGDGCGIQQQKEQVVPGQQHAAGSIKLLCSPSSARLLEVMHGVCHLTRDSTWAYRIRHAPSAESLSLRQPALVVLPSCLFLSDKFPDC